MNNPQTPQQNNDQNLNTNQTQQNAGVQNVNTTQQNVNNTHVQQQQTAQQVPNNSEGLTFKKLIGSPTSLLLRIGLAFVFLYAAFFVSDFNNGAQYVPVFITNFISIELFLRIFGVFEVLLAFWLLLGIFPRYAGFVAALTLTVLTGFNLEYFGALFRNIGIICAALALFALKDN